MTCGPKNEGATTVDRTAVVDPGSDVELGVSSCRGISAAVVDVEEVELVEEVAVEVAGAAESSDEVRASAANQPAPMPITPATRPTATAARHGARPPPG